jgi:hypothetical protein
VEGLQDLLRQSGTPIRLANILLIFINKIRKSPNKNYSKIMLKSLAI